MTSIEKIIDQLTTRGWVKLDGMFSESLIDDILAEYREMEPEFLKIQQQQGIAHLVENATHHSFVLCRKMFAFLEEPFLN
jgi:hypothetical protein